MKNRTKYISRVNRACVSCKEIFLFSELRLFPNVGYLCQDCYKTESRKTVEDGK